MARSPMAARSTAGAIRAARHGRQSLRFVAAGVDGLSLPPRSYPFPDRAWFGGFARRIGLAESEARKRKKKHKNKKTCKGGTRKCGKKCIPSTSCCSAVDCDDGSACTTHACNPDGVCSAVSRPDLTDCGSGKKCSGGECASPPTCRGTGDPCILPADCCGDCTTFQGMGSCTPGEDPNQPCHVSGDCDSGTCVGFVCTP